VKCGEALSHFENFLEDVLRLKASQKVKSKFDFCLNVGQAGSWAGFFAICSFRFRFGLLTLVCPSALLWAAISVRACLAHFRKLACMYLTDVSKHILNLLT
jgi:hypothetical protein